MKKIISCLVVLTMCISLAACGGTDKQAAIDAFNKASTSFNEVAMPSMRIRMHTTRM